jgi:hypothetical protein
LKDVPKEKIEDIENFTKYQEEKAKELLKEQKYDPRTGKKLEPVPGVEQEEKPPESAGDFLVRQAKERKPGDFGQAGDPGYQVAGPAKEKTSRGGQPLSQDTEAVKNQKMVDKYKDPTGGQTIRSPGSTIFYTGPKIHGKAQKAVTYTDPETKETYTDRTVPTTSPASGAADEEPGIATGYYTLPHHGGRKGGTLSGYYLITPEKGPNAGQSFIYRHTDIGPKGQGPSDIHTDFNAPAVKQIYGHPKAAAIKGDPYIRYIGPELPENIGTGRINDEDIPSVVKLNKEHQDFIDKKKKEQKEYEEMPLEGTQIGRRLDPEKPKRNPIHTLGVNNRSDKPYRWHRHPSSNVHNVPDAQPHDSHSSKDGGEKKSETPAHEDKRHSLTEEKKPRPQPRKSDDADATGGGRIESPA